MRTQSVQRVATVAGAAFLGLVTSVQGSFAQAAFPVVKRTKNLDTSLVRAMDECTAPTLTVMSAGMPAAACPQTNAITDDTVAMQKCKLWVRRNGKLRLLGRGFTVGDALRVRLTLRVTQQDVTTDMGVQPVTFSDVTVECPKAPDAWTVKLNGSVSAFIELGACLAPDSGLQLGNIEILDARVINVLNGRVLAAPGIMVRP
jgi:hypothetical protein